MFSKGEYIVYGAKGVCEVVDITTIRRDGVPDDRLYYLLMPLNSQGSKVFTPVENDKVVLRPLISREDADALMKAIPEIEDIRVTNEKQREQAYKECMKTGECREYLRVLRTLYHRKKKRMASGKKTTSTDERYLKMAQEALFSELAQLFGMSREEITGYVMQRLEEAEPAK